MVSPFCAKDIQELWQPFLASTDWEGNARKEFERKVTTVVRSGHRIADHIEVGVYWAICPKCRELLIQVRKSVVRAGKS